jgi:hypothetical protein
MPTVTGLTPGADQDLTPPSGATSMCSPTAQRQRSPILPLVSFLLLATGLALYGVASALQGSGEVNFPSTNAATLAMANRFYEAANTVVSTGDAITLEAILAPDFVDHLTTPGLPPGRVGLIQLLLARHATMPESRLVIDHTLVAGDEITVRVHVESETADVFLGLPLPDDTGQWGPQEILRIEGDLVVERYSSARPSLLALPLWSLPCPVLEPPPSIQVMFLEALLLAPGAHQLVTDESATQLVYVASGRPTTTGEPMTQRHGGHQIPLPILRPGVAVSPAAGGPGYTRSGEPVTLAPGDLVELPATGRLALANDSPDEAHLIIFAITPDTRVRLRSSEFRPTAEDAVPPGSTIAAGRLVLAPGTTFALPPSEAPVLAVVEDGWLEVATPQEQAGTFRWQPVHARQGIAAVTGDGGTWHVGPDEPAVIFVVTIGTTGVESPDGPTR